MYQTEAMIYLHANRLYHVLPSGTKRYGYQNVQEFYRIYRKSYNAYIACKEQVTKWEKTYGDDNQKQSPLVFVKYNNLLMMNTPKYDIIDL